MRRFACIGLFFQCAVAAQAQEPTGAKTFAVTDYARRVIYHSPQSPGYTCWVGAWLMPDQSIMVAFTQATGPVTGRKQSPKDLQTRLGWPPEGMPAYDMTGLDLRNVHLRSKDGGITWEKVSADGFTSPLNGVTGECETALPDGTVLRGVFGFYLPYNPELPQTGFLQRSLDGTRTWGKPELPVDPKQYTLWPRRMRVLKDGRLILMGGIAHAPANTHTRVEYVQLLEPYLAVSKDGGKTWSPPIPAVPEEHRKTWKCEECDAAELPNGDLLFVFRRPAPDGPPREVRWQGLVAKRGETWTPVRVGPAPFPHSGHPELLATREGAILHVATSGIHATVDSGVSWQKLDVPGTDYYPRSVQMPDGRIFVFAHVGSDDPYGKADQSITMQTFRLRPR